MREVAEQRYQVRTLLFAELEQLGINTNEAREAVDVVMDVASTWHDTDRHFELAQLWNTWTFNECAWVAEQQLDQELGEEADGQG